MFVFLFIVIKLMPTSTIFAYVLNCCEMFKVGDLVTMLND